MVFQWNKRDLPNIVETSELSANINRWHYPEFEAIAIRGDGVFETLKAISKRVLMNVKGGFD